MAKNISIWESSRPKNIGNVAWTKMLVDELFEEQMKKEQEQMTKSDSVKSLDELEIMNFEPIKVDSLKSFPSGYDSRSYNYQNDNYSESMINSICTGAINHSAQRLEQATKQHELNRIPIENNLKIQQGIVKMMEKFGVKTSWSTHEYKSSRSRTRSEVTHHCSWYSEVNRFIKTSDGFSSIESEHKQLLETIEKWKAEQTKKLQLKQREIEQKEQELVKSRTLAQLQVKYGLAPTAEFRDIRDVLLDKNKYLHLAYWLERNRGDWNDGYHYANIGLDGFKIETETDQLIYDNIQSYIDDWDGDGRVFRDCEWNYSVLYGMVEDEELMKDFEIIKKFY
jgi:hypothetical protein